MSYSHALESQLRTLDYFRSDAGLDYAKFLQTMYLRRGGMASTPQNIRLSAVRDLEQAETFYLAPDIVDILRASSASLPDEAVLALGTIPQTKGYVYFGKPIMLRIPGDSVHRDVEWCGFTWAHYYDVSPECIEFPEGSSPEDAIEVGSLDGVNITGGGLDIWWLEKREGWVLPYSVANWPFGEQVGGWSSANGGPDPSLGLDRRFVLAFLTFIEQRILISPQQRAERHARKRLEREGFQHELLVRVVELRRRQVQSEYRGDPDPVEWSHQWIVSGHWRQQWYPSLNANQPRWIMPYVKGPEDKPLKPPRAKVFAVVR